MRCARAPWWSYLVPAACGCVAFAFLHVRMPTTTSTYGYMNPIASVFIAWIVWRVHVVLTGSVAAGHSLSRFADASRSRPLPEVITSLPRVYRPSEAHVVAEQIVGVAPGSDARSFARTMIASYHRELGDCPDAGLFVNAAHGVDHLSGVVSVVVGTGYGVGLKFYAWFELRELSQSVRWKLSVAEMRNGVGVPYQRSHFSFPGTFVPRTDTGGTPTQEDQFGRTVEAADEAKGLQNTVTHLWMQSMQRDDAGKHRVLRGADPAIEADTREDEAGRRRGRIV